MQFVTPRRIIAATVAVMLVAGGAVASVGIQSYLNARDTAFSARAVNAAVIQSLEAALPTTKSHIETQIVAAQSALTEADGKTLDDTAQKAVTSAVIALQDAGSRYETSLQALLETWSRVDAELDDAIAWPPNAVALIESISWTADDGSVSDASIALTNAIKQLGDARAAWQAEQDRIAAEKAAAEAAAKAAAARRAAAASKSSPDPIEISKPAAPLVATADTVESYLLGLAGSASLNWVASLCDVGTICGITALGSSTPEVYLDSNLHDYYLTREGKYVLVHEAAHVRSWYRYGSVSALIAANNAISDIPPLPPSLQGTVPPEKWPTEYMADCATIVKLGYSLGTYTSSCTDSQLAEAATYW